MIKILHIARPLAGVGVYISLLAKNLDDRFQNTIVCNKNDKNIELKDRYGNELETYHVDIIRNINLVYDIKCFIKIIKIIKKVNPDIIHCHSAKSGILGRIAGLIMKKKTFYTPHAYSYLSLETKFKMFLFKMIELFFGLFPSFTLACSKSEYNKAIFDLKINKSKVFLWENSIEDIKGVKNTKFKDNSFICSIGRPSYQKNTLLLVKSILEIKRNIPDIHLVILGVGFYSPSLVIIEEFIKDNDLENNITLIPWLNRDESLSILKESILFISTSRYEGLSYATLEALALSKPCILTNVDGNREVVKEGVNGFLTEENVEDISKKTIEVLSNIELIKFMASKSREKYQESYSINNNIKSLEKLYLQ